MERAGRPWVRRQTLSQLGRRPSLARQASSTSPAASPPSRGGQRPGLVRRQSRRGSVFGAMNFVGASSGGAFGVIRRKLSTREEATVREVFDLFDEEGSGCISRDEVGIVIQSLLDSDALPDNDLRAMVNLIDKDKASSSSSSIYFEDFRAHLEYVIGYRATLDADPSAAAALPPFDPDKDSSGEKTASSPGMNVQLEARLRDHWLKLAGTIAAAAHAVGEAEQRGSAGTLGAFRNYRTKRQHDKDAQQKRLDLQHNEVVSLFRLRRLSMNAVGAVPEETKSSSQGTATSPIAFANRGLSLSWRRSTTSAAHDFSTGRKSNGGDCGITGSLRNGIAAEKDWMKQILKEMMGPWDPESKWRRPWNVVIVTVVCLQAVYVPFLLAFRPSLSHAWKMFEYTQDFIFLADICFTFNTALPATEVVSSSSKSSSSSNLQDGQQERDHTSRLVIACHYLKSWFLVDVIASVPIELVTSALHNVSNSSSTTTSTSGPRGSEAAALAKAMRVPKLLRLLRMVRLVRAGPLRRRLTYFFYYSNHANTLKLVRLLLIIVMIGHYLACAFYAVAGPELWFRLEDCPGSKSCYKAPAFERYVTAYYTIFLLINGEETRPRTDAERSFAVLAILVGSVIVATIFGNVSIIIMNFSANESAYRRKMESLYENMHHLQLPQGLKQRIVDYYDQMWRHYRSLDGSTDLFLPELNSTLGSEVLLYMRTTLVTNAPFFTQCSPMLTKDLVLSLKTEVYLKGDYIVHKGMPGREMYFISRGKCEVTNNFIRRAKKHEEIGGDSSFAAIPSVATVPDSNASSREPATPVSSSSNSQSRRRSSRFAQPRVAERRGSWIVAPAAERRLSALRADVLQNLKTAANAKGAKAKVSPAPAGIGELSTAIELDEQNGDSKSDEIKEGSAEGVFTINEGYRSGAQESKISVGDNVSNEDEEACVKEGYGVSDSSRGIKGGQLMAVERVLRVLPRGSYFGEAALLSSARRGGNVRARAFCEVQTLTRASFEAVLSTRPEERRLLKALLLQACSQTDSALLPQLDQQTAPGHRSTESSPHTPSKSTGRSGNAFKEGLNGAQVDPVATQEELARRLADVEKLLTEALAKQKSAR